MKMSTLPIQFTISLKKDEKNSAKAVGIDNIGGKFLKVEATIFADHITKLCNLSISKNFEANVKLQN